MNCNQFRSNIAAFLAGEMDERALHEHRQHAEECMSCAGEVRSTAALVGMLTDHPGMDVPEQVEARVLSKLEPMRARFREQMPSPTPLRSRLQGALTMKRAMVAVGLMVVAAVIGLGVLPSNKGNAALAEVARAMARVKSVHLIADEVRPGTGRRVHTELWLEHPARFRLKQSGNWDNEDQADDGTKLVKITESNGVCGVTISPSKGLPRGLPTLGWFSGKQMLAGGNMVASSIRQTTLANGRDARVIEFGGGSGRRSVVTIDETTDLLAGFEEYDDGKLVSRIEAIEYDIELPDALFSPAVPKDAVVYDEFHPTAPSPERLSMKEKVMKQMDAEEAELICNLRAGSSCGTPRHSGLRLVVMGPDATYIWYVRSRNAYYVFGKALAVDSRRRGYRQVVADGWLPSPYMPDRLPGTLQMRIDRPGSYRKFILPWDHGHNGFGAERIQNVGKGPLVLMQEGVGIRFYGEAKIYPQGTVYHDGQMANPWDIRSYGPGDEYDFAKADFGNLPASEIRSMKREMEKHNVAYRRYYRNRKRAQERLPGNVHLTGNCTPGHRAQLGDFIVDPEVGAEIYYVPGRDTVYVAGKVRLVQASLFRRTEKVLENEEVEAPSPDYKRYYEERQWELQQNEKYMKYRKSTKQKTKMTWDEWMEKHPKPE